MNKVKLGDLLEVKRGTTLSSKYYSKTGSRKRLTLGNFNYPNGGFKENMSKEDIFFIGDVKSEYILKKDDIITPLTEQVHGLLGETARIPLDDVYVQSGDIGLVIPNSNKLDNKFAYYLISSPVVKKQLSAGAQQTKIRHTSPDKIKDCQVYLPDLSNQKKIGVLLNNIDHKIKINNKINDELEAMAKTIYDYWFLQFEFPNEEGKPYKSSGGKMVWNEVLKREIPEGWTNGLISDLGEIISGGTPSTKHDEYYSKNGIAWVTPYDLSKTTDKYITHGEKDISQKGLEKSSAKLMMPKGSILLTSRAPIGYIGISSNEVTTNQGFKSIVPYNKSNSEYIYYLLKSIIPYLKSLGNGSTFAEISKETLSNIPIVIPNKDIIDNFNNKVIHLGKIREIKEQENRELTSLRDFLLPLLMNGQVGFKEDKAEG